MLYGFHLLLKERAFFIPKTDKLTEQFGAELGRYEMIQKTRAMLANHLQSLEEKNGVTKKLKDALERVAGAS